MKNRARTSSGPRAAGQALRAPRVPSPVPALLFLLAAAGAPALAAGPPAAAPAKGGPSHPAFDKCAWSKLADAKVGLEAWVQTCDYGDRKIDFLFQGASLAMRYSDGGGKPEPVVDVLDLRPGESLEAGMKRFFAEKTPKAVAARCVLAPYREGKVPAGVKRWTFVPDAAYAKELEKTQSPDEVPDPPCGDWGTAPDGIQYFETHPASGVRKFLFVRVGQDDPLFDEQTLKLLPAR